MGRIVDLPDAIRVRYEAQWAGRSVVLTNGYFDLLHVGHVRYLQAARALGGMLIVGLNADATARYKDPRRPIVPEAERAEVLAALACVDYVVVFEEDTAERLVSLVKPTIYAKGGDYGPGGVYLPETRIVEANGGKVVVLPFHFNHSSTGMVETIIQRYCPEDSQPLP